MPPIKAFGVHSHVSCNGSSIMLLSAKGLHNAGGRNASSAPRQRSEHSSAGVGLDFLNLPSQPLEAWAHRVEADSSSFVQHHSRVGTSHGRILHEETLHQQTPPSRGSNRSGSGLSGSGRTQESHGTTLSRASTQLSDDRAVASASRSRSGRIQVPDVMLGSTDSFDTSSANGGTATARSDRHLQRELCDLKQQFQFAALQHREDVNIMRSKLMDMQQQLSQAVASRDEAFEAIVNERAVAALRVQESEAAHREAVKLAQQARDKLHTEEQRGKDLMRAIDAAQKDLEHYKHQVDSLGQQQELHTQTRKQLEQQLLDSKRAVMSADEAQLLLNQQLQNQHQQHQLQIESLQSQFQQQLHNVQSGLTAAQLSLTDSERHRSNAEARANRNFEDLSHAMQQLQSLRLELQSAQAIPAAVSTAEFALLQQKLQFAQERLEMVQTHSKNQVETAHGLTLAAQSEVQRLQAELSGANNSLSSVQLQHQLLQQQMAVLKEDAMSSAAAAANAAATLSAYEMRIETMAKALEEQRSAHSMELHQTRDELTVLRAAVAQMGDEHRDVQSKLAAAVSAHSADRLLLAKLRPKVDQLTSINHKLTAALAVAQLQAAVGVDFLLSEAGFSSLSSKTPQQQASFLSKAKSLLQSVRQENSNMGVQSIDTLSDALESAAKISNTL